MHTVHTLVDCLFVDCRFPIDILYILVTCRLSFSYQCIPYMYNMLTCWLSCSYWCTRNMRTRWLSFPIDASRMYMLKRWLYCVYNLFSNTHRLILMWTYIHAKRNVLVMISDRRLSLCLCFANDVVVKEGADDIRVEVSLILHTNRDNLDYELSWWHSNGCNHMAELQQVTYEMMWDEIRNRCL